MNKNVLVIALAGLNIIALPAIAADNMTSIKDGVVTITLPTETAEFKSGPNVDIAKSRCTACHSAEYIYTQPPMNKEKWAGIVTKMQKVYGCTVEDSEVDQLAGYLVSQNGKK